MMHFVSKWKTSLFHSLSKVRQHKVDTPHGWMQFAEMVGPSGARSYGDVCPTWFPPDASFNKLEKGMELKVRGAAA